MTYTSVTSSNIRKGTFKNVRTALLNVHVDIGTKVYGAYPITNISLPLIVVENPIRGESMKVISDDYTYPIIVVVSVYAKQSEKIDTYSDAIEAAIKAARSTFDTYNLYLSDVVDNGDSVFEDIAGNKGHSKSLSIIFELK